VGRMSKYEGSWANVCRYVGCPIFACLHAIYVGCRNVETICVGC